MINVILEELKVNMQLVKKFLTFMEPSSQYSKAYVLVTIIVRDVM